MSDFDFAETLEINEPVERLDAYLAEYFADLSRSRL